MVNAKSLVNAATIVIVFIFILAADWKEHPSDGVYFGKAFYLRDDNGTIRGKFSIEEDVPAIRLFDNDGEQLTSLMIRKDGSTALTIRDASHKKWILLHLGSEGPSITMTGDNNDHSFYASCVPSSEPQMSFRIKDKPYMDLGLNDKGCPELSVLDRERKERIHIGLTSDSIPHINLRDDCESSQLQMSILADGSPYMNFFRKNNTTGINLMTSNNGTSHIFLGDKTGNATCGIISNETGCASIDLYDKNQTVRSSLCVDEDGTPSLTFKDAQGNLSRISTLENRNESTQ